MIRWTRGLAAIAALMVCATFAAALALAVPFPALAGLPPADRCEASKNKTVGAYYSCREKAEATAITKATMPDYSKCTTNFDKKWNVVGSKVATPNSTIFAGYSDWRSPNLKELETLKDIGAVNPVTFAAFDTGCSPACRVLTCSCALADFYWSSSSYRPVLSSAWGVVLVGS